jgi:hypothetical protein
MYRLNLENIVCSFRAFIDTRRLDILADVALALSSSERDVFEAQPTSSEQVIEDGI